MPGGVREDGSDGAVPADAVNARVEVLVERGLEKYGRGDLLGALCEWEHAVSLDAGASRAREYIEYVRANFDLLEHQFNAARDAAERSRAEGVPMPEIPEEVSGAYDLIELQKPQPTPVRPAPAHFSNIDTGWDLLEIAAPLPPPPAPETSSPRATLPLGDTPLIPPREPARGPPTKQSVSAPTLEEDLEAVAAGLDEVVAKGILPRDKPMTVEVGVDDMLTPEPGLLPDEPDGAAAAAAQNGEPGAGETPTGATLELVADEPPDEVTVPGGEAPPPLPDRPAFHADALQLLQSSPPVRTIHPRGPGEGTHPGELPAPPGAAAPPDLDLDLSGLGGLDSSVADDRASSELSGEITLASLARGMTQPSPDTARALGHPGEDTGEATTPAGRRHALDLLEDMGTSERIAPALVAAFSEDAEGGTQERSARSSFSEELPTAERRALGIDQLPSSAPADASREEDFPELEFGGDSDFADPKTSERPPFRAEPTAERPAGPPNVIVDEGLYSKPAAGSAETTLGADYTEGEAFGAALAADVEASDDAAATQPSADEESSRTQDLLGDVGDPRVRARVNELVSLAREAAERGDFHSAVEAAEAAAAEDPDGKVAPVILHRHRDLLFRIYEGQLGDLTQVPYVAVPLHEMTAQDPLDHRTGFLLSRIDGTLTFEDILDVAGMPRMEAYKILSSLLRKGFIDTR